jgi:hypothetical protein
MYLGGLCATLYARCPILAGYARVGIFSLEFPLVALLPAISAINTHFEDHKGWGTRDLSPEMLDVSRF